MPDFSASRGGVVAAIILLLAALGVGTALRMPDLGSRPMHLDEAILGFKFGELLETGKWEYDPKDYHGPALPYVTLPFAWATGHSEVSGISEELLRTVPFVFCMAIMVAGLGLARGMGAPACGFAGLFLAVSPMFVYYSRYYIMEMLLVFFCLCSILCGWRYYLSRRPLWLVPLGISLAMMHATKETCVIHYFAMAGGVAGCWLTNFFRPGVGEELEAQLKETPLRWSHLKVLISAAAIVWLVMFTSFFTIFPQGLVESITTYGSYLARAEGAGGHEKPWFYYFQILLWHRDYYLWTEAGLYVLAIVGAAGAFFGRPKSGSSTNLTRFLTFYVVLLGATYSAISYKTPWTIMGFHHAVILLAGFGSVVLLALFKHVIARIVIFILIGGVCVHLGAQAKLATSTILEADVRNPYVYSHTSTNFMKLVKKLDQLAAAKGGDDWLQVKVVHFQSAWPLPWYTRMHRNSLQFSSGLSDEMLAEADVIITEPLTSASPNYVKRVHAQLRERGAEFTDYGFQTLRPDHFLSVQIRASLWEKFLEGTLDK